jgi:glycosyltransferase involved in cell wall biosynthesis
LWNLNRLTMGEASGISAAIRRRTEQHVIAGANALVTVSEPWADRLQRRYPSQKIVCISNGFDEDDFPEKPAEVTKTFTITHTGQLYQGRRDPTLLLQAVRELITEGALLREHVRLRFYGPIDAFLAPLVAKFELEDVVEIHNSVPRSEALRLQRESHLLLLLPWWNPEENGVLTGKLFEYLGSRRPVLAVGGGHGAVTELLKDTNAGVHALCTADLKGFLLQAYSWFRTWGQVPYRGNQQAIRKFTHREMALKFSRLLDSITANAGSSARQAA